MRAVYTRKVKMTAQKLTPSEQKQHELQQKHSFNGYFAAALCAAFLGTPFSSPAGVAGVEIPDEELALYVREQSIREEIKQADKEIDRLKDELKTFESSIETMKTEALSDFREKLRQPGLSVADKAAIRSAYEKQCEEIESKLAAKKRQAETAIATIEERLGSSWRGTGLYGETEKIGKGLQETVAKEAPDALSRLLDNGMVAIPGKDYRMGRYEVDQALWQAVMGENPSWFKGAYRPVEQVSWNDVQEFLRKLNAMPDVIERDIEFRLPTEQEWEYACRAGATGKYCLLADGTEITKDTLGRVAWFEDNADSKTHPVGQKKPNAFGLYDMHGNVLEWTSTADGEDRVFRGGSWDYSARSCESSGRFSISPSFRLDSLSPSSRLHSLGFRLCASGKAD